MVTRGTTSNVFLQKQTTLAQKAWKKNHSSHNVVHKKKGSSQNLHQAKEGLEMPSEHSFSLNDSKSKSSKTPSISLEKLDTKLKFAEPPNIKRQNSLEDISEESPIRK